MELTEDTYGTRYEEDMVVTLHYGMSIEGNIVLLWQSAGLSDDRRWIFERISDDVDGEVAETIDDEIERLKLELETRNAQITFLTEELARKNRQLAKQAQMLGRPTIRSHQSDVGDTDQQGEAMQDGIVPNGMEQRPNNTG
ncbi:hypothetical protein FRC12_003753 [Ceratobasidium sp. 428]|nr:hypothetical protein FRC12_003753 [Ceratobasidium sp. 428]